VLASYCILAAANHDVMIDHSRSIPVTGATTTKTKNATQGKNKFAIIHNFFSCLGMNFSLAITKVGMPQINKKARERPEIVSINSFTAEYLGTF